LVKISDAGVNTNYVARHLFNRQVIVCICDIIRLHPR